MRLKLFHGTTFKGKSSMGPIVARPPVGAGSILIQHVGGEDWEADSGFTFTNFSGTVTRTQLTHEGVPATHFYQTNSGAASTSHSLVLGNSTVTTNPLFSTKIYFNSGRLTPSPRIAGETVSDQFQQTGVDEQNLTFNPPNNDGNLTGLDIGGRWIDYLIHIDLTNNTINRWLDGVLIATTSPWTPSGTARQMIFSHSGHTDQARDRVDFYIGDSTLWTDSAPG